MLFFWSLSRALKAAKWGRKYPTAGPSGTISRLCKRISNTFISQGNIIFLPQLKVSSLSSSNYKQTQFWQSPLGKIMLMQLLKIPLLLRLFFFFFPQDFTAVSCSLAFFSCTAFCSALNGQSRDCFLWNMAFCLWTRSSVLSIKTLGSQFASCSPFKAATMSPGQLSKWGYTLYN